MCSVSSAYLRGFRPFLSAVARRRYAGACELFVCRALCSHPETNNAALVCNRLVQHIAAFNARVFLRRYVILRNDAFATRTCDPPRLPAYAAANVHWPPAAASPDSAFAVCVSLDLQLVGACIHFESSTRRRMDK
jgi:hypothetical protein